MKKIGFCCVAICLLLSIDLIADITSSESTNFSNNCNKLCTQYGKDSYGNSITVRVPSQYADPRETFPGSNKYICIPCDCGNGIVDVSDNNYQNTCPNNTCGNPNKPEDISEECDDGNNIGFDGCTADCKREYCGDGIKNTPGETCDKGSQNGRAGSSCSATCKTDLCLEFADNKEFLCGNGKKECDEECDDGNKTSLDGCSNECKKEYCGDGIKNTPTETCDKGTQNGQVGSSCSATCKLDLCLEFANQKELLCGNGTKECDEECDDGNKVSLDGCSIECKREYCGDGIKNTPTETCDKGSQNGLVGSGCNSTCKTNLCLGTADEVKLLCGNGTKECDEECDDGNKIDGDGCSVICKEERECVWVRAHSYGSTRRWTTDYIWDKEKKTSYDKYEEVPSCFTQWARSICAVNYYDPNTFNGAIWGVVAESQNNAAEVKSRTDGNGAIRVFGDCLPLGATGANTGGVLGHLGTPGTYPVYMDKNCNYVEKGNSKVCGFAGTGWTPISLVLDPETAAKESARIVNFKLNPYSAGEYSVWKASDAAPLLVYNPENKKEIKDANQLLGNWSFGGKSLNGFIQTSSNSRKQVEAWKNGYEALAQLDLDQDGKVSGKELKDLMLWFDGNRDAKVDPGELKTLSSQSITGLFYKEIDLAKNKKDLIARVGFERNIAGKIETGTSTDWLGEQFVSIKEATDALSAIYTNSNTDNHANNSEFDIQPKKVDKANFAKDISGSWIWNLIEDKKAMQPGIFTFEQTNSEIKGYNLIESALEKNGLELFSAISKLPLEGKTEETPEGMKISFIVTDKDSGGTASNTVILNKEGTMMHGITKQTFLDKNGESTLVEYEWVAGRVIVK